MSYGHIKTLELRKDGRTYSLEVDSEDPDNLVIESVTIIDAKHPKDLEADLDPTEFEDTLNSDDWRSLRESLNQTGGK